MTSRIEGVLLVREWPANDQGKGMCTWWCPGCERGHSIYFGSDEVWSWDGNTSKPTFEPSVLVFPHGAFNEAGKAAHAAGLPITDAHRLMTPRCHTFVRAGRIEYLADCEHALAGQTIDMVPLPERYANLAHDD